MVRLWALVGLGIAATANDPHRRGQPKVTRPSSRQAVYVGRMSYFLGSSNGLSVVRPPPPQALPSAAVHPFGDETGTFLSGLIDSGSNFYYRKPEPVRGRNDDDAGFSLGFNSDTQNQNGDPMKYCLKADHLYFWILCPSISEVEGRRASAGQRKTSRFVSSNTVSPG